MDYTDIFWISPTTGGLKILGHLDYETAKKHILTVQASDQEKTATASVSKSIPLLHGRGKQAFVPLFSHRVRGTREDFGVSQGRRKVFFFPSAIDQKPNCTKPPSFWLGTAEELQLTVALLFQVTVNVLDANDEEPVCSPDFYSFQLPVTLAVGTNINGFRIECQDRDSDPRSFRYFINEGNVLWLGALQTVSDCWLVPENSSLCAASPGETTLTHKFCTTLLWCF